MRLAKKLGVKNPTKMQIRKLKSIARRDSRRRFPKWFANKNRTSYSQVVGAKKLIQPNLILSQLY